MKIHTVENLIIDPINHDQGKLNGGPRFHDHQAFLHHLRGQQNSCTPNPQGKPSVYKGGQETILFAGPLFQHFGHFLAESLSRLWPLIGEDGLPCETKYDRIAFCPVNKDLNGAEPLPPFTEAVFDSLGIPANKILMITEPTEFSQIQVPDQAMGIDIIPAKHWLTMASAIGANATPPSDSGGIYYISRQRYRHLGSYLGEALVAAFLEAAGVTIIHPQDLSFEEQLGLYQSADGLIFAEGSALYSLLYVANTKAKITLIKRRPRDLFEKQLKGIGLNVTQIGGMPQRLDSLYKRANNALYTIDLKQVLSRLKTQYDLSFNLPSDNTIADALEQELFQHIHLSSSLVRDYPDSDEAMVKAFDEISSLPYRFTYFSRPRLKALHARRLQRKRAERPTQAEKKGQT